MIIIPGGRCHHRKVSITVQLSDMAREEQPVMGRMGSGDRSFGYHPNRGDKRRGCRYPYRRSTYAPWALGSLTLMHRYEE